MTLYLNDILEHFCTNRRLPRRRASGVIWVVIFALALLPACGGGGSNGGGGGGGNPPAAPTNLTATGSSQQVSLAWTASSGATSYHVKRGSASGGPYTQIASVSTTNYTDTGLTNGTAYYYVVSALNSNGESGNSNEATATPNLAIPAAPTGVNVTAGNTQVALTWNASSGATSYNVKRSTTNGGPYTTISSPTSTSYTDTGLTNGTAYYYVITAVNSAGESGNSSQVSATPNVAVPAAPTGLVATPGNAQVSLSWNASTGATSYHVKRSTTNGSGYSTISSPATTTYTDTGLTDGTTYYYVVSAVNNGGESANSSQVSATPTSSSSASVHVTVDVLANRHTISPYIYGGAFPLTASTITDSGLSVVRWGGNAASTYNWQLFTDNADNDYYFEDFTFCGLGGYPNPCLDSNSTQWITDVQSAGSKPLMTMVMLPWVAQSAETSVTQGGSNNYHWSFSVSKYGAQCSVDPYNVDAGNGKKSDCTTYITGNDPNDAYYPLLDGPAQSGDPTNSVYRNQWAAALASAFGSGTCAIPYSSITSCHFYDMDNEIDIWGGTHVDIHPNPSGYEELRDVYLTEARNLKTWDSQAVRLGPVSCCWWFYWNGANGSDKGNHAGNDFLPWWLNEVYWQDQIAGARSLDIFDIHAYPDGPDTTNFTQAQKQALAVSIYRDYWDPTLVSPSSTINQPYTSNIQPNKTIAFRIPRMRAIANMIYPGTPLAFTEWSAAFAGEGDFSTALGDADAYGILGRERVSLATRWTAPSAANPNYLALKLFTNYDGSHHAFGTISVSDTNDANPNLFSSYAALNSAGTQMTLLVLNKDPQNAVTAALVLNGFNATSFVAYTLASSAPTAITHTSSSSWTGTQTFAPYSATLLVLTGSMAQTPASSWDLNPDTTMVPASGTVMLAPKLISGSANVSLSNAVFDSFEGASACSGTINITTSTISSGQPAEITVNAGSTPGFCHFTVTGTDSGATQTQGGWIVVGNPAATLTKTGDNQTGSSLTLTVTLAPGSSGGTANSADIFFTTTGGTLSNRIVTTNSGQASLTLTLPSGTGQVTVTAEGPYGLGHPVVTFTEHSN